MIICPHQPALQHTPLLPLTGRRMPNKPPAAAWLGPTVEPPGSDAAPGHGVKPWLSLHHPVPLWLVQGDAAQRRGVDVQRHRPHVCARQAGHGVQALAVVDVQQVASLQWGQVVWASIQFRGARCCAAGCTLRDMGGSLLVFLPAERTTSRHTG